MPVAGLGLTVQRAFLQRGSRSLGSARNSVRRFGRPSKLVPARLHRLRFAPKLNRSGDIGGLVLLHPADREMKLAGRHRIIGAPCAEPGLCLNRDRLAFRICRV